MPIWKRTRTGGRGGGEEGGGREGGEEGSTPCPISTFSSPQEQVQHPLFTLSYMIKMQLTAIEQDDANTWERR